MTFLGRRGKKRVKRLCITSWEREIGEEKEREEKSASFNTAPCGKERESSVCDRFLGGKGRKKGNATLLLQRFSCSQEGGEKGERKKGKGPPKTIFSGNGVGQEPTKGERNGGNSLSFKPSRKEKKKKRGLLRGPQLPRYGGENGQEKLKKKPPGPGGERRAQRPCVEGGRLENSLIKEKETIKGRETNAGRGGERD